MTESKLHAIVVGSGLAVWLRPRGSPNIATGGQGIVLYPNGVKILESVGFDGSRAGGVPCHGYRMLDKDGKLLEDIPIDFKGRWGAEMLMMKRSDFRDELMRIATAPATEPSIKGEPAKLVFNTSVVDLDPDTGTISLADGSVVKGDIIIDGIHSTLRKRIIKTEGHVAKKTGLTLFRIAVPTKDAQEAVGSLPEWWDDGKDESRLNIMQLDDPLRIIASYPIRRKSYHNLSCLFPMHEARQDILETWYKDGDKEEMLQTFDGFDEKTRKILSIATEVKVWDLEELDTLPNWHRGRALVIGDAAHAMTPLQGQGANMAIEDADSLRLLLPGMSGVEIESALQKIDSIRRPRAAKVLQDTRKQTKSTTLQERLATMDYNCSYKGIYEALEKEASSS
ncbi:unnamed protein product [Clonostachys solani]|uniref:FAD-binding domain-containing protein n=1 Tax=Clonostachys solani TaxID=160281 RepID=A0A9P0ELD1_9HYPO|nr:unnamed protein product [Clonostachys solani]